MIAIRIPKTPMNANENLRLDNSAMYPMIGGPIRKPKKLTLETVVKATLGDTFGVFPAMLYTVGTIVETPKPTNINAMVAGMTNGKNTAVKSPAEIMIPLNCITIFIPNL